MITGLAVEDSPSWQGEEDREMVDRPTEAWFSLVCRPGDVRLAVLDQIRCMPDRNTRNFQAVEAGAA